MKTRFLLVTFLATCHSLFMANAVGQTARPFDLSAYERVSTGVFANFSYPAHPAFSGHDDFQKRKSITLKSGIFFPSFNKSGYINRIGVYLKSVDYADVTKDKRKEAIVTLGNICDCSGVSYRVYVFKVSGSKPRLLWSFSTGDRAYGGLHRVYAQAGDLIVETYGAGSGPGKLPKDVPDGWCCGKEYTRRRYKWAGSRFVQKGKEHVVPVTCGLTKPCS